MVDHCISRFIAYRVGTNYAYHLVRPLVYASQRTSPSLPPRNHSSNPIAHIRDAIDLSEIFSVLLKGSKQNRIHIP